MITLDQSYFTKCQFKFNRYEAALELPKNMCIAEVGVLAGDFSEWLLQNMNPSELHLIDIFNCDDYPIRNLFRKKDNYSFIQNKFITQINDGRVKLHKGNSWEMLNELPDSYFDMIYIDAAHDYKSVKKDLAAATKKVKNTGYIVMNDYIMYDHHLKTPYGVVQATNEFCLEQGWEVIYLAFHPELFCDVFLKKIS